MGTALAVPDRSPPLPLYRLYPSTTTPPPAAAAAAAELGMRRVKLKVLELRSRAERERSLRDREECEVVLYLH